jgi:hypothetical protein
MGMSVGTLPAGTIGGDCDQPITAAIAKALYDSGVHFVLRYISRNMGQQPGDLTANERNIILGAGLALGYVQHVLNPGWTPSLALGLAYGEAMAANMMSVGAASGALAWLDWEGVDLSAPETGCVAYINGWAYGLTQASSYVPGIYVGYDSILTPDQLYYDLAPARYWKSASRVAAPTLRGWCMVQTAANPPAAAAKAGLSDWDADTIVADALGGLPSWDLR